MKYMSSNAIPIDKMISVTEARRNLGDLLDRLPVEKEFFLMRGNRIAAKLVLSEEAIRERRRRIVDEVFGAWKGTDLDSDELWDDILHKKRIAGTKKKRVRL